MNISIEIFFFCFAFFNWNTLQFIFLKIGFTLHFVVVNYYTKFVSIFILDLTTLLCIIGIADLIKDRILRMEYSLRIKVPRGANNSS